MLKKIANSLNQIGGLSDLEPMTKMEVVAGIITELDKCFSSLTVSIRIRYHQHHLLFLKRKSTRVIQRVTSSCFKPGGDRLYDAQWQSREKFFQNQLRYIQNIGRKKLVDCPKDSSRLNEILASGKCCQEHLSYTEQRDPILLNKLANVAKILIVLSLFSKRNE